MKQLSYFSVVWIFTQKATKICTKFPKLEDTRCICFSILPLARSRNLLFFSCFSSDGKFSSEYGNFPHPKFLPTILLLLFETFFPPIFQSLHFETFPDFPIVPIFSEFQFNFKLFFWRINFFNKSLFANSSDLIFNWKFPLLFSWTKFYTLGIIFCVPYKFFHLCLENFAELNVNFELSLNSPPIIFFSSGKIF